MKAAVLSSRQQDNRKPNPRRSFLRQNSCGGSFIKLLNLTSIFQKASIVIIVMMFVMFVLFVALVLLVFVAVMVAAVGEIILIFMLHAPMGAQSAA